MLNATSIHALLAIGILEIVSLVVHLAILPLQFENRRIIGHWQKALHRIAWVVTDYWAWNQVASGYLAILTSSKKNLIKSSLTTKGILPTVRIRELLGLWRSPTILYSFIR